MAINFFTDWLSRGREFTLMTHNFVADDNGFQHGVRVTSHSSEKDLYCFENHLKMFGNPYFTDIIHTQIIMYDSVTCGIRKFNNFCHFLDPHLVQLFHFVFRYYFHWSSRLCVILEGFLTHVETF